MSEFASVVIEATKRCLTAETHRWARLVARKRWMVDGGQLAFVLQDGD